MGGGDAGIKNRADVVIGPYGGNMKEHDELGGRPGNPAPTGSGGIDLKKVPFAG